MKPLNKWLSYVNNLVEMCDNGNSKKRIINGCASEKAKNSIIRKGDKINVTVPLWLLEQGSWASMD